MEQLGAKPEALKLSLHNCTGDFDDLFNSLYKSLEFFILQAVLPSSNPRLMNFYLLLKKIN